MKFVKSQLIILFATVCVLIPIQKPLGVLSAQAQSTPQPTVQQRVAMLKQWLNASQNQIRAYEWIETTIISKEGTEQSRTQKRCYYGVDGKLQKVVLQTTKNEGGGPPGVLPLGRLAKKAAAHKQKETKKYMQSAVELVHSYIPPVPGLIQHSVNDGKMSVQVIQPGRQVRLSFGDYLKPGDTMSVDMELPTNRLLGLIVKSYLDSPADAVSLNVGMSVLPDGTIYPVNTKLAAPAKHLLVTIENTGYRRITP